MGWDSDSDDDKFNYDEEEYDDGFTKKKDSDDEKGKMPVFEDEEIDLPDFNNTSIESLLSNTKKKRDRMGSAIPESIFALEYFGEGLDNSFLDNPWVPPDLLKASEFKSTHVHRGGTEKINNVKLSTDTTHGEGFALYFQLTRSLTWCAFYMFIFSLPSLLFAYYGYGVSEINQDLLGVYQFTIANIGYDVTSDTYATDSACTSVSADTACVHVYDDKYEFTMRQVSSILTVIEIIQTIALLSTIYHVHRSIRPLNREIARGNFKSMKISDYSILVTNVPKDVTKQELVDHFSRLYYLDAPDWCKRPPVRGAAPVSNVGNTNEQLYLNSWVADIAVYASNAKYTKCYLKKRELYKELYRLRAQMKAYGPKTPHHKGPRPKLFARSEKRLLKVMQAIDALSKEMYRYATTPSIRPRKVVVKAKPTAAIENGATVAVDDPSINGNSNDEQKEEVKAVSEATGGKGKEKEKGKKGGKDKEEEPPAAEEEAYTPFATNEAITVILTFNYPESMARCVEDYGFYSKFPFNLLYPSRLKLRGYKLQVMQAPQPDDIVWESIEIANSTKVFRRTMTGVLIAFFVLLNFAIIAILSAKTKPFAASMSYIPLCTSEIPSLYTTDASVVSDMVLTRPSVTGNVTREDLDKQCQVYNTESFYAVYTNGGDLTQVVGNYSLSACSAGFCPVTGSQTCPCVSYTSTESCVSNEDTTFPAKAIDLCYCNHQLSQILSAGVSLDTVNTVKAEASDPVCQSFLVGYSSSIGLIYVAVIITLVINYCIYYVVRRMTSLEGHGCNNTFKYAMFNRSFLGIFINSLVPILVAYGSIHTNSYLALGYVFQGSFSEFTSSWYCTVGPYVVLLFVLQGFLPIFYQMFNYCVRVPYRKWCAMGPITLQSHPKQYLTQFDLNLMTLGSPFNVALHTCFVMVAFCYCLVFSAGIPILNFLCFLVCITYFRMDKKLYLRYYLEPLMLDDRVTRRVLKMLVYLVLLRLGVTIYMFSNTDILSSSVVHSVDLTSLVGMALSGDQYTAIVSDITTSYIPSFLLKLSVVQRAIRPNTFPLLVLFLITFILLFIRNMYRFVPIYWVFRLTMAVNKSLKAMRRKKDEVEDDGYIEPFTLFEMKHPLRREFAPFTDAYYKFVPVESVVIPNKGCCTRLCTEEAIVEAVSADDRSMGWDVVTYESLYGGTGKHYVRIKVWPEKVMLPGGITREKGSQKCTFEILNEMRVLFSYQENMIQAFRRLMLGDNELVSQEMYFHYGKRKGKKGERVATYTDFKLTVANIQITYADEEAAQEKQKQKKKGSDDDDDDSDEEKKKKKPVPKKAVNNKKEEAGVKAGGEEKVAAKKEMISLVSTYQEYKKVGPMTSEKKAAQAQKELWGNKETKPKPAPKKIEIKELTAADIKKPDKSMYEGEDDDEPNPYAQNSDSSEDDRPKPPAKKGAKAKKGSDSDSD